MLIKIVSPFAGDTFSFRKNQLVDVRDELAAKWVQCGMATVVELADAVVNEVSEHAAPRRGRPKRS
jgi:hypothetical protein